MEVYMRLNGDVERDYAFRIGKNDTLNSKLKCLFDEKKGLAKFMVLRPSIFHEVEPTSFLKSVHPGILTENGSLIYSYDADKKEYVERLDVDQIPLVEQLWPGQLIIPKFKKCVSGIIVYILVMAFWLYTDLPDSISPTPGICLTNQVARVMVMALNWFGLSDVASRIADELDNDDTGLTAQWLFFVFHVCKVGLITFFFVTGMFNPMFFNPLKLYWTRLSICDKSNKSLATILKNVGWLGSRKQTFNAYRDFYYNYVIKKAGSTVKAYKDGLLATAVNPGVILRKGEGFQTPLKDRVTNRTFETIKESRKFVLSDEYFQELDDNLKANIDKLDNDMQKVNAEISRFRSYGLLECSDKLTQLVQDRKEIEALLAKSSDSLSTKKNN